MTGGAWIMLVLTWSVVIWFTAKYFWMVLRKPPQG